MNTYLTFQFSSRASLHNVSNAVVRLICSYQECFISNSLWENCLNQNQILIDKFKYQQLISILCIKNQFYFFCINERYIFWLNLSKNVSACTMLCPLVGQTETSKFQINPFRLNKILNYYYHAQLQYISYISQRFEEIFYILGAELREGQNCAPATCPPIRHVHDNTPCSQRLRGKNELQNDS